METANEETIASLKHLVSICNDGKEGYKHAAENCDSPALKALFTTYSIQRSEFEMVLKTCIHQLGANAENESGGPLGILHRTWIDIKTALTPNDNKAVLEACITGEKAAIDAYRKVLDESTLSVSTRQIIYTQRKEIEECLNNISNLEHQYA